MLAIAQPHRPPETVPRPNNISNLGLKHYQERRPRVEANTDDAEDLGTAQTSLPSDQVLAEAGAGIRVTWPKKEPPLILPRQPPNV